LNLLFCLSKDSSKTAWPPMHDARIGVHVVTLRRPRNHSRGPDRSRLI